MTFLFTKNYSVFQKFNKFKMISLFFGFCCLFSINGIAQSISPYNYKYFPQQTQAFQTLKKLQNERAQNASAQNPSSYIRSNQPCWDAAAAYHHVDPWLLYAIAYVESHFRATAVGKNTNGSVDLGMMQINSIWYPALKKQGIPLSALKNACASTYIGAWILSKNIKTYGYTWKAIGAYNSGTPSKAYKYAQKVYRAHDILVRTHDPRALYASSEINRR